MKKKIINIILITITLLQFKLPVQAANYTMKELIPIDIETTIVTNRFSYKHFYYNTKKKEEPKNAIIFTGIKNLSDEERPITISIALFDSNQKNIGTINYCTKAENHNLAPNQEEKHVIEIKQEYLSSENSANDIKYIAVLSENINCRTSGSQDYIGQTIKEIGIGKNNTIDTKTKFTIQILSVVGGVLLLLFIYIFMFTGRYENMDGEDVRIGYKKYNQQLKDEREYQARVNPPKPKEKIKVKTDEVLAQEEMENNKDKTDTDLHNLYK